MIEKGTVSNFYKEVKIKKGYYDASVTDLNGFRYRSSICPKCKEKKTLFTLNPENDPNNEWICIDCLESGDYSFQHYTEIGFVDLDIPEELKESDAKDQIDPKYYKKMAQTPNFLVLQNEEWLCHCNDFMVYKGTWEAPDFTKNSPTNNGKELFLQMTDGSSNFLWDNSNLKENETESSWEDCLYHAFECDHCGVKRGYYEL